MCIRDSPSLAPPENDLRYIGCFMRETEFFTRPAALEEHENIHLPRRVFSLRCLTRSRPRGPPHSSSHQYLCACFAGAIAAPPPPEIFPVVPARAKLKSLLPAPGNTIRAPVCQVSELRSCTIRLRFADTATVSKWPRVFFHILVPPAANSWKRRLIHAVVSSL